MKPIHIFKTGTHTSSSGQTLPFTEEMLQASVAAYDPEKHEAPIVVGHPKDNGPAFGWVGGMSFAEGNVFADPRQINDDFAEQVKAGAYKKISASWYLPDSPSNPVPGVHYLRHVGFLGAQPPAIKGLQGIEFSADDEGVVEFSADWEVAGVFRRLREFLIEKFGVEDADKAIPSYLVEGAEDEARRPMREDDPTPAFSEPTPGDKTMPLTEEQIAARQKELDDQEAALKQKETDFAERERDAATRAEATRIAGIREKVGQLVKDGTIADSERAEVSAFAESLPADGSVEFGEGDTKTTRSSVDSFFQLLTNRKPGVDFSERSGDDHERLPDETTAEQLADMAVEYREEARKAGRVLTITEATNAVAKKLQAS
ncbi:MAG: peptidase [Pseudomonadota bacterium]